MTVLLRAEQVTKRFGAQFALNRVSLAIAPGEVVGLAGRSGAGKTLLTRILAGLQSPDEGQLWVNGRLCHWPFAAADMGIGIIHQKPKLADQFDITGNIFLGHEIHWSLWGRRLNIINQRQMDVEAQRLLTLFDVEVPSLREKVLNLPSDTRQLLAILQGIAVPAQLRIVDDPTAQLGSPQQAKLLSLMDTWQQEGTAVLFSSQNLDHLFAVTDRIIVLRQGELVANLPTDETSREEIVAAMVGTADWQQRTPVIWALDSYYQAKRQAENLSHNQQLLEQDLAVRDSLNQQLLSQLSEQVQALDRANLALQDAQRRLLIERELERKHLARELHDDTIQDLLSLNYQLEEITALADGHEEIINEVGDVRRHVRQLISNIRGICGDLRPPTIDSLGLGAALQSFVHTWSDRTNIAIQLELSESLSRLPESLELSIFRIVQEGLSNIAKHAHATQVHVTLTPTSPRMLRVMIGDNGQGLPPDFDLAALSQSGHYGLLGISERVALMGGRLTLHNQRHGGLMIQVDVPHPRLQPVVEPGE